jgi:hypothetical protein
VADKEKHHQVRFMCVSKKVFNNLCDLFPVTAENIKQRGLEKRFHYLKAMEKLDMQTDTYKALKRSSKEDPKTHVNGSQDSLLAEHTLKALDDAANGIQNSTVNNEERTFMHLDQPSLLDHNNLEDFFSDEDEQGGNTVENLQGVMKRVGKKAALMIEGINLCQQRMESNFRLIKSYMQEGKKPNADFKRQVLTLSDEFVKTASLKFTRENAEEVYAQAQDEWKRQYKQIAEAKASKNEDKQTMMQKKNETEQIINKALLKGKKL